MADDSTTKRPFRLAILTAMWGRPHVTVPVLQHVASLDVPGVELVPIAVWSREDKHASDLIGVPGWTFVQSRNRPLSNKWNAGARAAVDLDVDGLTIIGSDDYINAEYAQAVAGAIEGGAKYVMPRSIYFLELSSGTMIYCGRVGHIGGGRTLSRFMLDRLHWRPWEPGNNKGIDGAMDRRLMEIHARKPDAIIEDIRAIGAVLLGIKDGHTNMQPMHKMRAGLDWEPIETAPFLFEHLPNQAEHLLGLCG